MKQAVIGLGSNLGDSGENLKKAIEALAALPHTEVLRCSSLYRTPPVEVEDEQPDYLNQCVWLQTDLSPHALLGACLESKRRWAAGVCVGTEPGVWISIFCYMKGKQRIRKNYICRIPAYSIGLLYWFLYKNCSRVKGFLRFLSKKLTILLTKQIYTW